MAILQATVFSRALNRTVPITVILPSDKYDWDGNAMAKPPFQTLYLLHGAIGSTLDWITRTRITRWAMDRKLAVVMPSGDNSYYIDHPLGREEYGRFISQELVELTRNMFPLSHRREDTFIGGLSMGGYGAIRNGLLCPETFGSIIALSSALYMFENTNKGSIQGSGTVFGDLEAASRSDKNPAVLIDRIVRNPQLPKPRVYCACGTEDGLLDSNRLYRDRFLEAGFELKYVEAPGGHEWDFWDTHILDALNWLPLGDKKQGISSGNVGK